MKWSRQTLLGMAMFVGSSVLLYATVQQLDDADTQAALATQPHDSTTHSDSDRTADVLTADIETESRLLEQKRLAREAQAAEQEARTQTFLAQQQEAKRQALQKTRLENEQFQNNSVEPVDDGLETTQKTPVARPVVRPRTVPESNAAPNNQQAVIESPQSRQQTAQVEKVQTQTPAVQSAPPSKAVDHQTRPGDGLIKLARRYNVPVEALARANNVEPTTQLLVGQMLTIPAAHQIPALIKAANKPPEQTSNTQTTQTQPDRQKQTVATSAPTRQLDYQVKRGDGLIKLARQYNVPVGALAKANNLSTSSDLRVGQSLIIPSRKQVARLEREQAQAQREAKAGQTAQARLREARSDAANGEAKGTFGVQVALADNQAKADDVAKQMRAAGYSVSTSATSRGVRVIVGPEKGKPAALALKDKINADSRVGVDGAWVLYWR